MEIQKEKQNPNNDRKKMKIERSIVFYDKRTEHYVGDFPIQSDLNVLKQLFTAKNDDPLLYDPYEIDEEKSELLKHYIDFEFDFDHFYYCIEASSIE